MPVFISYSHKDKVLANKLAAHLVSHNANVWVDSWELSVGDSILDKIQEAIQDSSALLVVLSKASVESEWCKKEMSVGLMRELDEKKVIVLPVLAETCDIPLFLKGKKYADLRTDFGAGLQEIVDAVAKVASGHQGRLDCDDETVDWSQEWGYVEDLFHIRYTIINSPKSLPMTFLTQVYVYCNETATRRYKQYEREGLGWVGRSMISGVLFDVGEKKDFRIVLDSSFPAELRLESSDSRSNAAYEIVCESRRLGLDNGKDQLLNLSDYLTGIQKYVRSVTRSPSPEETETIRKIVGTPWGV